jgi:hypothetical protein
VAVHVREVIATRGCEHALAAHRVHPLRVQRRERQQEVALEESRCKSR